MSDIDDRIRAAQLEQLRVDQAYLVECRDEWIHHIAEADAYADDAWRDEYAIHEAVRKIWVKLELVFMDAMTQSSVAFGEALRDAFEEIWRE